MDSDRFIFIELIAVISTVNQIDLPARHSSLANSVARALRCRDVKLDSLA